MNKLVVLPGTSSADVSAVMHMNSDCSSCQFDLSIFCLHPNETADSYLNGKEGFDQARGIYEIIVTMRGSFAFQLSTAFQSYTGLPFDSHLLIVPFGDTLEVYEQTVLSSIPDGVIKPSGRRLTNGEYDDIEGYDFFPSATKDEIMVWDRLNPQQLFNCLAWTMGITDCVVPYDGRGVSLSDIESYWGDLATKVDINSPDANFIVWGRNGTPSHFTVYRKFPDGNYYWSSKLGYAANAHLVTHPKDACQGPGHGGNYKDGDGRYGAKMQAYHCKDYPTPLVH